MKTQKLSAKEQAIKDIKREFKAEKRPFISFIAYLNPVMKFLVNEHIKEQRSLKTQKK